MKTTHTGIFQKQPCLMSELQFLLAESHEAGYTDLDTQQTDKMVAVNPKTLNITTRTEVPISCSERGQYL